MSFEPDDHLQGKHNGMRAGDQVKIEIRHADGQPYRRWPRVVKEISEEIVVVQTPLGSWIDNVGGNGWRLPWHVRRYLWFDREYHVMQMYGADGTLEQLHGDVGSPAKIDGSTITFIDCELDIVWKPGEQVQIADQDEFAEAAATYAYSPEFQEQCWKIAEHLKQILMPWEPKWMSPKGTP
ncbi:DUF402 domain-containing protein [bacterium]|nr:DUF402 domain-containing protein [bacterium]